MNSRDRLAREFQDDLFPVLKKTVGIGLILIILLVPAFSWVDYYYYPEYFKKFFYYRLTAAGLAAILFYFNLKSRNYRTTKIIGVIGYYVVSFCIIFMIKDVNGFGTPYYAGLLMVFVGFISILPLDFKTHLFHIFVVYACYVASVFMNGFTDVPPLFWVNNVFLISSLAILLVASFFNYRLRFSEFASRKKLIEAEESLRQYADRLRENVKESESRYASVVNNAREGIIIIKKGTIDFCNPRAKEILHSVGIEDDIPIYLDLLPDPIAGEIGHAYDKAALKNENTLNKEFCMADEFGRNRYFEYTVVPIRQKNGPACVLFLRDITAKKQMEDELIQSQKMEAVGLMAGGVAHDLNNVFQIVSGYVQMGMELAKNDSKLAYYLGQIEKTVGRAANVAKQLLIFARKDESKKEVIDVNAQIVSLTKLLHRVIPKMIQIDLRLSADAGYILADPVKFEQVLLNLCINARDAMPDGGRLEISTSKSKEFPYDKGGDSISKEKPEKIKKEHVCIKIADSGCGIDPNVKTRIFDPFFTTKEKGKGTGLGLAIVYVIVKDHNGFIKCESEPGKGTTFSIFFPSVKDEEEQDDKSHDQQDMGTETNERILLVDDEEQIRDIGADMLKKAGYDVVAVDSGEAALDFIKEKGSSVSLILLDLNMPGMGGLKFLERMREKYSHLGIKVIICTGFFDNEWQSTVERMGVNKIVSKPFKFSEIVPIIKEVLSSK